MTNPRTAVSTAIPNENRPQLFARIVASRTYFSIVLICRPLAIANSPSLDKWLKKQSVESGAGQPLRASRYCVGNLRHPVQARADSAAASRASLDRGTGSLFFEELANSPQYLRVHGRRYPARLRVLLARMIDTEESRALARQFRLSSMRKAERRLGHY